jgi:hypothetical protein
MCQKTGFFISFLTEMIQKVWPTSNLLFRRQCVSNRHIYTALYLFRSSVVKQTHNLYVSFLNGMMWNSTRKERKTLFWAQEWTGNAVSCSRLDTIVSSFYGSCCNRFWDNRYFLPQTSHACCSINLETEWFQNCYWNVRHQFCEHGYEWACGFR